MIELTINILCSIQRKKKNNDQLMVTNQTTEQNGMVKLSRLHILSYYIQKGLEPEPKVKDN
jgi:hypothetical protein